MHNYKSILSLCLFLFLTCRTQAQTIKKVEFTAEAWEITAKEHEFVSYKGKKSLHLTAGKAKLKNSSFKNGIIDYDVVLSERVNFTGMHFRINGENHEEFYTRSHQSGNPDATQYTPVINGNSGWQLYTGKGHSKAYNFNFKEWMHIRLIVNDGKADVYINDMSQPFMHIADLKLTPNAGPIGFSTFPGDAYFANLCYQEIENPPLLSKTSPNQAAPKEVISSWQVSSAFADTLLNDIDYLSNFSLGKELDWQTLTAESSGTINLARVSPLTKKSNAVLVKVIIRSNKKQLKQLDFGYSDRAIVFINQEAIYKGNNNFRSRDYRYLGSMGYYDSVFLPLKKGNNELVFAVSEDFGGWGLKAKLANLEGVTIE